MLKLNKSAIVAGLSTLISISTLFIGQNINKLGFPFPFIYYKGGNIEKLQNAYEINSWINLKHSSFRVDYFAINVLFIYVILTLVIKIITKFKR